MLNITELFETHGNEHFLKFDDIPSERRLSNRPDLNAFLLLDKLVPGSADMISAAKHDQIYLSVDPDAVTEVATEEQIVDLIRCGVWLDTEYDSFSMFV